MYSPLNMNGLQGLPAEAAAEDAGAGTQVGGDVNIPDEDVPLDDGEDLRDLDDEDVPLADLRAVQQWRMGYLPAYAGIGLAALILLAGAAVYFGAALLLGLEELSVVKKLLKRG